MVGVQQKSEGSPPAPANPPIQTNGEMKEKGVNESSPVPPPAPSEGQGVWNSQSQAKHIPAISKFTPAPLIVMTSHHPCALHLKHFNEFL